MDPVTIGLLLGGSALGGLGAYMNKNESYKNAAAQAAARNQVLAGNIAKQEGFAGQNRGIFDTNMQGYEPEKQGQRLADAQGSRTATNVGQVGDSDPNSVPISDTAPKAVRSEIAKRMLGVHDASVARAQTTGKLGGYGDTWQTNQLGNNDASRNISVINSQSAGRKSLLVPEQDAAANAAYKPPSMWGTLLGGAGELMSGYAGRAAGTPTSSLPRVGPFG